MRRGRQGSARGNCQTRPSSNLILLCKDDITNLNRFVLQREHEKTGRSIVTAVINDGLLDGIVEGQNLVIFGYDARPTLFEKAAHLLVKLTFHQCFAEGNKRTAWEACRVLLGLNEIGIYYNSATVVEICKPIAQLCDKIKDLDELNEELDCKIREVTDWIKKNAFRIPRLPMLNTMLRAPPVNSPTDEPRS